MRRVQALALDLFEARGFAGVTIEEIALSAGLSAPTVYRHFGTKEQLVLWDEYDPMILASLAEATEPQTLLAKLEAAFACTLEAVSAKDAERVLRRTRLVQAEPALRQANLAALARTRDALAAAFVAQGACSSEFEAEVVAGAVVSALDIGVSRWARARKGASLSTFVGDALRHLGRLTAPPTATPTAPRHPSPHAPSRRRPPVQPSVRRRP